MLEFLDEVAKKNTSLTPRAVKDYKNFENDAVHFFKTNTVETPQAQPLSSRRISFREKSSESSSKPKETPLTKSPSAQLNSEVKQNKYNF